MKNIIVVFGLSVMLTVCAAKAQSVWTGSGSNARWSMATNWQGSVAPVPGMLTSLTFGGSVTNAQNDFLSGAAFSNLTFAAGASPFTLSGNAVSLYGTLVNSSSVQQRIGTDLAWSGKNRTLDTGAGGIVLDGYLSSGATNAYFVKSGTGTLTLNGGGNWSVLDPAAVYICSVNAGTVVITADTIFNRLDLQNGTRLVVTNNATLSGFTGSTYEIWQASTIDLYSGKIILAGSSALLGAQNSAVTTIVNVRGGMFVGSNGLRWANNGNMLLTLSGDGEFQWLAGNALAENGGCRITMNGGLFRRAAAGDGDFNVGYDGASNKKNVSAITNRIDFNAGTFLTGSFTHSATTNFVTPLFFNGGTVRAGKTTTAFFGTRPDLIASQVGPTGLVFDTQSYTVTFNDALENGSTPDGGLTKLGAGTLILATNCTYTGATTVSNGLLRIEAPLASTALRLAPYASATLANTAFFSGSLSVACGATFAFTTNATTVLSLSTLALGNAQGAGIIAFDITDASNLDQINVTTSGGLDLSRAGEVLLYQPGTTARFSANGTYPLFTYAGALVGSTDNLRVANPDPAKLYQFSASAGWVTLTISDGSGAQWISATDGTWSQNTNWSGSVVPNAANAYALFMTNAAAALTVTLDAPATVGSLAFSNAAAPYTLAGNQTLTLDAGTQQAALFVQAGQHTVAAPLALARNTLAQPAANTTLTLAGALSGTGPLTVTGAGTVALTGTNQTQTVVRDGRLTLCDGASLAGGTRFDNGTLAVSQNVSIVSTFEIGSRNASMQPATNTTLTFAAATSGEGTLRQDGLGTLRLSAALGNAGGVLVSAGTLDFTNDVFGTKPLQLGGGTARHIGANALTLNAPITVSGASLLRTEQAGLTLSGTLAFSTATTLGIESTNGVTLVGTANVADTGRKLNLREGTLRLASGADYTLSSGARDTILLGRDVNRKTELVIESGARLKTGGIYMGTAADTGATNCDSVVRQEGGRVEVTHSDSLFIRDFGASAGTYLMNGGTFLAPASSWTSLGTKGPAYLTVNGGTMTLGRVGMGYLDSVALFSGPGGNITVNGGRLNIAGSCSWMSDTYAARYNTAVLGNGTPGLGELDLVATTRAVPYASGGGRTAFTFNGGLLKTTGLASYGTSSLTNYLYGVDTLTLRSGGAIIETPGVDITIVQPLRAADTAGGVVKRGLAALTLPSTNNAWFGLTDVQAGTLRTRLNQNQQRLYPEGLLALWTFDDGSLADRSGNGFDLLQQNNTNLVAFVDGGACGKAARFPGVSGSLKLPYASAFNVNSYSVSLWVNLAAKDIGHQGFFSTRVDTGEASAGGTFDFKFNAGNYISCFNSGLFGANIAPEQGGNLTTGVWYMVTYVVTPVRMDAYLNGVLKSSTNNIVAPQLLTAGHLLTLGRGVAISTDPNREMLGAGSMIDDVAVFARALSSNEVAALYTTVTAPQPPLRVASTATLDLLGTSNVTTSVTGGGTISNGVLTVTDSLTPDADSGMAILTVDNLVLGGTNLTYACTTDAATNDLVRVTGTLSATNTGTIALGHTSADPLTTPFRRTVMTYGTLAPADAQRLTQWRVTGDGISGSILRKVVVDTVNQRVNVEIRHVGSLIFLF